MVHRYEIVFDSKNLVNITSDQTATTLCIKSKIQSQRHIFNVHLHRLTAAIIRRHQHLVIGVVSTSGYVARLLSSRLREFLNTRMSHIQNKLVVA